jgi:hypothetical protein
MAGDLLTKQQRVLWKRAEQHGGVRSMLAEADATLAERHS